MVWFGQAIRGHDEFSCGVTADEAEPMHWEHYWTCQPETLSAAGPWSVMRGAWEVAALAEIAGDPDGPGCHPRSSRAGVLDAGGP